MDEGGALLVSQVLDGDGRHLGPAFGLCGHQASVSVDHAILAVDADRDDHAKLPERLPELFDLFGRV